MFNFTPSDWARWICGLLLLTLAASQHPRLQRFLPANRTFFHWSLALVALIPVLISLPRRLVHSNLGHYYIGAKYELPYFNFYEIVRAARNQPPWDYRNLRKPHMMVRANDAEKRYHCFTLLENHRLAAPTDLSTSELILLCETSGVFAAEARSILDRYLPGPKSEALRADLQRMDLHTDDNGFNGSPLYVLLRKLDPSIYVPFGPLTGLLNLTWQLFALIVTVSLLGSAFSWSSDQRSLAVATFLCAWDYNGWALNGLSWGGWVLPLATFLWAWASGRHFLGGCLLAAATLLKLFPAILCFPLLLWALMAVSPRRFTESALHELGKQAFVSLLGFAAACVLLLFLTSALTRVSWGEFLLKIVIQFRESILWANTVSLAQVASALGVPRISFYGIPELLFLGTAVLLFCLSVGQRSPGETTQDLLLFLVLSVWVMANWLNYYAVLALLALPSHSGERPNFVSFSLAGLALASLLPDYDACYQHGLTALVIPKVLPHLFIAAGLLYIRLGELFARFVSLNLKRVIASGYVLGLALMFIALCYQLFVTHLVRNTLSASRTLYARGNYEGAETMLRYAVRFAPGHPDLHVGLGEVAFARETYEVAAEELSAALRADPNISYAWMQLGLTSIALGRTNEALRFLGRAVQLAPHDAIARYNFAAALKNAGQLDRAKEQARWAVRLDPALGAARELFQSLEAR